MRLAISNIAWDVPDDAAVAALLARHGIDAIDIAPGKYFPDIAGATRADIRRVREWWSARGVEITGMQALLYGTSGLNMFGERDVQGLMLDHLANVCRIAGELGATRLTFGSPKNRDRHGLTDQEADRVAFGFFRKLGDIAAGHGVFICLEPNPARYNCNFMTTTPEAARVVTQIAHPAIRLQLDAGTMTINREQPGDMVRDFGRLVGHVHASEPDLLPVGQGETDHAAVAHALRQYLPEQVVSIEMRQPATGEALPVIEGALLTAIRSYRPAGSVDRGVGK
jgi:sugar phosphate isomerase/epimerase